MENQIIFKNTLPQTIELVDNLANDDEFRGQFERDPKAVLAKYNIMLPSEMNVAGFNLPTKSEMQKMQKELINKQPPSSVVVTPNAHYFALFAFFAFMKAE